jgi:hypothetical protein
MALKRTLTKRKFRGEPALLTSLVRARDAIEDLTQRTGKEVLDYQAVVQQLINSTGIYLGPGIRMEDVLRSLKELKWIEITNKTSVRLTRRRNKSS